MSVPGCSVVPRLKCLMMLGMSKIKSSVLVFWRCSPLTFVVKVKSFGFGMAAVDAKMGPIGANLSNDLA